MGGLFSVTFSNQGFSLYFRGISQKKYFAAQEDAKLLLLLFFFLSSDVGNVTIHFRMNLLTCLSLLILSFDSLFPKRGGGR